MFKLRKRNLSNKKSKYIEHLVNNFWQNNQLSFEIPSYQINNQIPNYNLSINEDGNIIAIGLPYVNNFKGLVRIYYINDNQTFTQIRWDLLQAKSDHKR